MKFSKFQRNTVNGTESLTKTWKMCGIVRGRIKAEIGDQTSKHPLKALDELCKIIPISVAPKLSAQCCPLSRIELEL